MFKIYLYLLLFIMGLSGCIKKDALVYKKQAKSFKSVEYAEKVDEEKNSEYEKKGKSFFDEDTFVLEEDTDFNLFSEGSDLALSQGSDGLFEVKNINEDLDLSWIEDKDNNKFDVLYFDFNKYGLSDDQKKILLNNIDRIKEFLNKNKNAMIVCEGHTCLYGSGAYNLSLSEKRANNVCEILASNGIPRNRIKVVGRGFEMPIVLGGSKKEQSPNRRVEVFTVVN